MSLKVYVINLAGSDSRREHMHRQLNGIDFAFFEAIDGRQKWHSLFDKYDDGGRRLVRRRPLSGGELGCWASHYLLWEKCIDLGEPIAILEDDVNVLNNFKTQLKLAENFIGRLNFLRLSATFNRRTILLRRKSHKEFSSCIVRYLRGPLGTQCYVINPAAAKMFIRNAESWSMAVDEYIDRGWLHGVNNYALHPISVESSVLTGDIVRLNKPSVGIIGKLRYELVKMREAMTRYRYNVQCRIQERSINFDDLT